MTTGKAPDAPDFLTADELAQEADEREWRTVSEEDVEETKWTFDNMNEPFFGTFTGERVIDNENGKFIQYRFEENGYHYFINSGWSLAQGMKTVRKGQRCRITWVNNRDTGQDTPMRVFRVDVAKMQPARRDNT